MEQWSVEFPAILNIFISHPSELLTDHLPHGDGLMAYEFIKRLARRGHRVEVAYTSADFIDPVPPNVILHHVVRKLPSSKLQILEYMVRIRHIFRKVHRQDRIDIIHQLNPVFPGHSALLGSFRIPLILGLFVPTWPQSFAPTLSWRNRLADRVLSPLIEKADRHQQRIASMLLLSTPAAESRLHEPQQALDRCVVLPYGIDTNQFTPVGSRLLPPMATGQRVLYLGSLDRRKGVQFLAKAFDSLEKKLPLTELILAGEGPELESLQSWAAQRTPPSKVQFLGRVHRQDIASLIRSADLVVIPSLGEPFGMVALEAMACGKPLVATKAGGLAYLVPPSGGRLVPPEDPVLLGDAIAEMLGNPLGLIEMGLVNRKHALSEFEWTRVMDRLEAVYNRLLVQNR